LWSGYITSIYIWSTYIWSLLILLKLSCILYFQTTELSRTNEKFDHFLNKKNVKDSSKLNYHFLNKKNVKDSSKFNYHFLNKKNVKDSSKLNYHFSSIKMQRKKDSQVFLRKKLLRNYNEFLRLCLLFSKNLFFHFQNFVFQDSKII
jgi:hypothetical protein